MYLTCGSRCGWQIAPESLISGTPFSLLHRHRRPLVSLKTFAAATAASNQSTVNGSKPGVAEQESLVLLEWPNVCRQVSCFCQTALGAELSLSAALPIGKTQQQSAELIQQTTEALQVASKLTFKGIYDLRGALVAAKQGGVLHPLVLAAVCSTLKTGQTLQDGVAHLPTLQQVVQGANHGLPALQNAIGTCIQHEDGRILDDASTELAAVRAKRRENLTLLRSEVDEWAKKMFQLGASERPLVVMRRDRLCIPIKAGRQGDLPKGSVMLATSASGSTFYVEPAPAIELNNAEAVLASTEAQEEGKVLALLSQLVAENAAAIEQVLSAVTALDLVVARARYASWMSACQPQFNSNAAASDSHRAQQPYVLNIQAARHPLLLEPTLKPITTPTLPTAVAGLDAPQGPNAGLAIVPELWEEAMPSAIRDDIQRRKNKKGGDGASSTQQKDEGDSKPTPPTPIDLCIPAGTKVVAVTGPNTGGKTASLKTLGLLCLMAKAGMYLPILPNSIDTMPTLPFFDKILVDVGDSQSLEQSLSTFSGHVRRLKGVLKEATSQSLVLLDEVGSGTDPREGAALAVSVLNRLAASAALTYATTHHAEVKELASIDPTYINVSAEFDMMTLQPTYRLLWGEVGESNALTIARGLGFSGDVLDRAVEIAEAMRKGGSGMGTSNTSDRVNAYKVSLEEQIDEAKEAAQQAKKDRAAAEAALKQARKELEQLASDKPEEDKQLIANVKKQAMQIVADFKAGKFTQNVAESKLKELERQNQGSNDGAVALLGLRAAGDSWVESDGSSDEQTPIGWKPAKGETVSVLKMGGALGTVVSASSSKITVKVGSLVVDLKLVEVAPASLDSIKQQRQASAERKSLVNKAALRSTGGNAKLTGVAIQTTRNTVDVRGQTGADAETSVREAILGAPQGDILFIVHGIGTGKVRAAVLDFLKNHPKVVSYEEVKGSKGGATMVRLK